MFTLQQGQMRQHLQDAKAFEQHKISELRDAESDLVPEEKAYMSLPEEVDAYEFQGGLHAVAVARVARWSVAAQLRGARPPRD